MSWARLDDTFCEHPKVLALSDREFRIHVSAILYCARFRTGGTIPKAAQRALGLTPRVEQRFLELGLLDKNGTGEVHVHDFDAYNPRDPTNADRQARFRSRKKTTEEPDL